MEHQSDSLLAPLRKAGLGLFPGPRPGRKSLNALAGLGITHCCTLLGAHEDVQPVNRICQKIGCRWVWCPIGGGRLDILRQVDLAGHLQTLAQAIADEPQPRIYFHCSAGIHRTGFFVYAILRLRGLDREAAFGQLSQLRAVTADQVGQDRLDLADELVSGLMRVACGRA